MSRVNVDIRYADGRIFQCPMPTVVEAKEYARRMERVRQLFRVNDIHPELSARITGIMVTRWNGTETVALATHGTAFTY